MKSILSAILLFVSVTASAGFLPEQLIQARRVDGYDGPLVDVAFDGTRYVMVYTDLGQLRVQRIDETGALVGTSALFDHAKPTGWGQVFARRCGRE